MSSGQTPRVDAAPKGTAPLYGWGDLQHHDQPCEECSGTGEYDDGEECDECGGNEVTRWGSFYEQDRGDCDTCGEGPVPIAAMYEDGWICLPCWLHAHARDCGCELWRDAEDHYGVTHG